MMRRSSLFLLACAAWLPTALASAAEPAASTAVAPVTVQSAAPPKLIEQQSRSFVEALAAPTLKIGQIARWEGPVCVQVEGLVPEQAAMVRERVEEVAREVGLAVLKAGCASNIQIVFSNQPQALVDKIAKSHEQYLGFHYIGDLKKVKAVTHPVQSWYMTATQGAGNNAGVAFAKVTTGVMQNADKGEGAANNPGRLPGQPGAGETVDSPYVPAPTGCGDSPTFTACLASVFKNVLVVGDSAAVTGKGLGPVADYMAMLALSQPRSLDGCDALPSVIDLFAKAACPGRDAPGGLTSADAAYLTALYKMNIESKKMGQLDDISGVMAKILIGAEAPDR